MPATRPPSGHVACRREAEPPVGACRWKTIWTRCEVIDEPRGVTAQTHHPDPISGYSRTQCQLVDDVLWGGDIQLDRAVEDTPEVSDKVLLPDVVLACNPAQP